jgi:hypothetical protein
MLVHNNHRSMQSYLFTIAVCLKSEEKKPILGFPKSLVITLSHLYGEKFSCCISLCMESQRVAFQRIDLPPSRMFSSVVAREAA